MYPLSVAARCTGAVSLLILIALLVARPLWLAVVSERLKRVLVACGKHPVRFIAVSGVATFLLNASISCFAFWPIPSVHDEFAYVLTGDTFASGRLTNATHPFADHFASWHVIQMPSYQAKYPPAQGAALAFGQRCFGHQLVGVWLSLSLAIVAAVWAMFQWLPCRWAAYASLLIVFNPHVHLRWGQSYWGGAIALGGGALLVGALGRLRTHRDLTTGVTAGVGLAILAASRPFEGLLMAIPICLYAGWVVVSRWDRSALTVGLTGIVAVLAGGLSLAQYNSAVTGQWTKFPYRVWSEQQGAALDRAITPSVIPLMHVSTDSPKMSPPSKFGSADWRVAEVARMMSERGADAFNFNRNKLYQLNEFYLQTILRLPLLALPCIVWNRWRMVLVAAIVIVLAGSCTHLSAGHPHYIAGIAVALILIVTLGLRRMEAMRVQYQRVGAGLSTLILVGWLMMSTLTFAADVIERPREPRLKWAQARAAIAAHCGNGEAQHVLFVKYLPEHSIHQEWVYNGANIDRQSVIWANDLGETRNRELIRYLNRIREQTSFAAVKAVYVTVGDDPANVELRDGF